jgi:hypothetical protein
VPTGRRCRVNSALSIQLRLAGARCAVAGRSGIREQRVKRSMMGSFGPVLSVAQISAFTPHISRSAHDGQGRSSAL